MSARQSARRVDADPDWVRRRFREIDNRLDTLDVGTLSSVPGATVTIQQILTDPSGSAIKFWSTDTTTVTAPGDTSLTLTYIPIAGSLHVRWGALMLPDEFWTLSGRELTVLDPGDLMLAGDKITTAYAYDPVAVGDPTLVNFEASGWRWLQIGRTDATDYSAAVFDDSAWAVAAAPFGDGGDMGPSYPPHVTLWAMESRMWARRTITPAAGLPINVTVRADWSVTVWLDGVEVWFGLPNGTEQTFSIDSADVPAGSSVLAVRITDEASSLGNYFDMELTQ